MKFVKVEDLVVNIDNIKYIEPLYYCSKNDTHYVSVRITFMDGKTINKHMITSVYDEILKL